MTYAFGTPKAVHDTSIRADQIVVKVRPPRTGGGGANEQDPLPTIWGPMDPLPTIWGPKECARV